MSNFLSSNPEDLARALSDGNRSIEEREAQGRAQSLGLEYVNLQNFPLDLQLEIMMHQAPTLAGNRTLRTIARP